MKSIIRYIEHLDRCFKAVIVFDEMDAETYIGNNPEYMLLQTVKRDNPFRQKEYHLVQSDDKGVPIPKTITAKIRFMVSEGIILPEEEEVIIALHDYDPYTMPDDEDEKIFYYAQGLSEVNSLFYTKNVMDFKIISYELNLEEEVS